MFKKGSVILTLLVLLIISACGQAANETVNEPGNEPAASAPAAVPAVPAAVTPVIEEPVKVAGKLSFYTSQPEEDATKLVAAFNKQFPDVQVETFRSGTEEVIAKLQAENLAGQIQADVLLVADSVTFEGLKKQDMLLSYKSPQLDKIPTELIDTDGMYTGTKVLATVIAIHTGQVKEVPTSWNVLIAPESKDSSIMPSPIYSGAAAYNVGVFTRMAGFEWTYFQGLKANNVSVVKGNGAVLKAVASGEKSYGMVVDFIVAREKALGSPVELVYPSEGVPVITEPIGILKKTANEPAAKAFVDFVLSDEGQQVAAEIGYTPIREGIQAPAGLKSISEFKVLSHDISVLTEARESDKRQFIELFGE